MATTQCTVWSQGILGNLRIYKHKWNTAYHHPRMVCDCSHFDPQCQRYCPHVIMYLREFFPKARVPHSRTRKPQSNPPTVPFRQPPMHYSNPLPRKRGQRKNKRTKCFICCNDIIARNRTQCSTCHKQIHVDCLQKWWGFQERGQTPSCCFCRSRWVGH